MINVSNEFKQLMNKRTNFKENAIITFADGSVLELKEKDFTISNNSIIDASGTSGIPLGVAVCKSIQIELMNDDERFSEYDFFGAKIRLFLTFELSESVEKIERGTFTVLTPETYGTTIIITALDEMYKADSDYDTKLVFPATIKAMLIDACNLLDLSLGTTSFLNDDFIVNEKPTDITFRQLFGYISMIAGGNARIDNTGRLTIISYDFRKLEGIYSVIDGGNYFKWDNESTIDGGIFRDSNTSNFIDGGQFGDRKNYHVLSNWKNLKVDTDDVVITGVSATYTDKNNEEKNVIYGIDGYVLNIENPLITGKEETAINLIGNVMVGGRFRQFNGDLISNPTIEFMDTALIIDRKENTYISFITDINFQFFGFTTLSNSAETTIRNSAKTYSQATQTLVTARKLIKNERTAREQAVAQLVKDLQNSSGLFMTQEEQEDKSIIYYMHDKPTLSESIIIWKLTALAFAISTDGGNTYPYGFSVDGTTITRLLYAEGIDADYIDTGAIRITDTNGNTMFLADYDTKNVYINATNVKIGTKSITDELVEMSASISLMDDKIELKASKGELSSLLSVESGAITIKSNRFSWDSTYSSLSSNGKLTARDVDLSGKITATNGEIGGFNIGTSSIYSGKSSLSSGLSGVYIGTDGISVGAYSYSPAFKVSSDGDIEMNGDINFKSTSYISYNSTNLMSFTNIGVTMEKTLKINSLSDLELDGGDILMKSGSYIKNNLGVNWITFDTNKVQMSADKSVIGKVSGYVGFFGLEGSLKKTVSNIATPSSATASTIATKLNDLLTSLRSYNLIG